MQNRFTSFSSDDNVNKPAELIPFNTSERTKENDKVTVIGFPNGKGMAEERLRQLQLENIALIIAVAGARVATQSKPAHLKCLWRQINRNRDEKKRSKNNCLLRGAERQCAIHLHTKYADLKTRDTKRRRKSNFDSPFREADRQ